MIHIFKLAIFACLIALIALIKLHALLVMFLILIVTQHRHVIYK